MFLYHLLHKLYFPGQKLSEKQIDSRHSASLDLREEPQQPYKTADG